MRQRVFAILVAVVAAPSTCSAQHVVHLPIHVGWETTCYPLGTVTPGSEVAALGRKEIVVSYAVDRLWLVLPFWNGKSEIVLSRPYGRWSHPNNIYSFDGLSVADISALTGLSKDHLQRPWSSYVPFGWSVALSLLALVKILNRPASPHKRFLGIWAEPRYRAALALMFEHDDLARSEFPFVLWLPPNPVDPGAVLREILPALEEEGLPPIRAESDLEFASRYLVGNRHIIFLEPGRQPPEFA